MKKRVFNTIGTTIVLALSVLIFLLFSSMRPEPERKTAGPEEQILPTTTVKNERIQIALPVNGKTTAVQKITLYSEVSGILESGQTPFLEGIAFSKGDTMLLINSDEYEASLKSAKVALYTKFAQLLPEIKYSYPENYPAWLNYFREFSMENTIVPLPKPKSEQEKLYIAGQGIYTSYYTILGQETRRAKYAIIAPFDGVVTASNITPGTLILSGQSLGTFIQPGIFEMEVNLPVKDAEFIHTGDQAELESNDSGNIYHGTISRKNAAINTSSQSVSLFILIRDARLLESEYLSGTISSSTYTEGMILPNKYLNNNHTIYILNDSSVSEIPIQIFQSFDEYSIVTGLADNTLIITRSQGVYHGMLAKSAMAQ